MTRSPIQFSEHLIQDGYNYTFGVTAIPGTKPGVMDLIAIDIKKLAVPYTWRSFVYRYINDGNGHFTRQTIHENEPGWLERQTAADLTGNGHPDLIIVNNKLGNVIWLENEGPGSAGLWKRHLITSDAPQAYDVAAVDLDGDGFIDIAVAGWRSHHISLYRNPGREVRSAEWQRTIIDSGMTEARTMCFADFNNDGRPDLVCTSTGLPNMHEGATPAEHRGSIVWYENPGHPSHGQWTKHIIDNQSRGPCHGHPADLDGDGNIDIVMAIGMRADLDSPANHEIAWYENIDNGKRWVKHHIGKFPFAFEAIAVDLDGDGALEVVATAWSQGNRLAWFKHNGDPRGRWTMHVIREDWPAANQVIAADLTGNGRADLIASSDDGSHLSKGACELRWWRNEGAPQAIDVSRQQAQTV